MPPPARGRLARRLHPRGRGEAPPRPQHGEGPAARAPRVPPQPPALLPQAQRAALARASCAPSSPPGAALEWLAATGSATPGTRGRRSPSCASRSGRVAHRGTRLGRETVLMLLFRVALGASGTRREDRDRRPQVARLRDRDVRPQRGPPPRAARPRDHVPPLLQPGRRAHPARPRRELRPGGGRLGRATACASTSRSRSSCAASGRTCSTRPHYVRPLLCTMPSVVTIHDCIHLLFPAVPAEPHGLALRPLHDGRAPSAAAPSSSPSPRPRGADILRFYPCADPEQGAGGAERARRRAAAGPRARRRWSACGSATRSAAASCSTRATSSRTRTSSA